MTSPIVDKIVQALLYEGYILYPYRPSVKNRQRWTFGGLYPEGYTESDASNGDPRTMQVECLVSGKRPIVSASLQFLHLIDRQVGKLRALEAESQVDTVSQAGAEPEFEVVESLEVGDRLYQTWQEAVERTVPIEGVEVRDLTARPRRHEFSFAAGRTIEMLRDPAGDPVGVLVRQQREIAGAITLSAVQLGEGVFRLTLVAANDSAPLGRQATRDDATLATLASTHAILHVEDGAFISLLEPPEELREAADDCHNLRVWPVLVGEQGETHTVLASPIILYDYPQIAPESPGDLFDGTEIDEILTLRIMTLTDEEKRLAGAVDERARALLQRTDSLGASELGRLHGTLRGIHNPDSENEQ